MRLDGVRVGGMSGLCFLSPFSPLTETNPLIKLSGIKLKSQLSKRSITILKKKKYTTRATTKTPPQKKV